MNPTERSEHPEPAVPLRDARLVRALAHAPDVLEPAQPGAELRNAILRAAHEAVDARQANPAAPRGRDWRATWSDLWGRVMGTGRMPWSAALATMLLAGFITLLWRDETVPSAQTDQPIAQSSPRTDPRTESPAASADSAAPASPVADNTAKKTTQEPSAHRAAAPAVKPERERRSQEGAAPSAMDVPPVATAPPVASAPPAAERPQAAPAPAPAPAPSIAPERATQQEKSMAARRSAAVADLAAGAVGGGVPQDWTALRGVDGVAVARVAAGELPRLLESLRSEAAAPDARTDSLGGAEGDAAAPVVRVELLRTGQLLGSLELAGRRWRFTPLPGDGAGGASVAASQGVLGEAEAQVLRAAMQRLPR